MKIIVGIYDSRSVSGKELEAASGKFLQEIVQLLPALSYSKVVIPPAANLETLNQGQNSAMENGWTDLLAALEKRNIDGAFYPADMLPDALPDTADFFSLPAWPADNGLVMGGTASSGLALVFSRGEKIFKIIRNLLLPPTVFAGAGIGGVGNVTQAVVNALKNCDVCVFDALIPAGILEYLPKSAEQVFAGKRNGSHSMKQDEINRLLVRLAKSGQKVVRLKGGDPTVFGRLAEETSTFQQEKLPFRVLPGISTLNVAAAATGLLPTRRRLNRGFSVATPRRAGSHTFIPLSENELKESLNVYYMAATLVPEIVARMSSEGFPPDWPISLIYDVGSSQETLVCGTLADIVAKISRPELKKRPALVLTGKSAAKNYLFQTNAPLEGKMVLCCGEQSVIEEQKPAILALGGRYTPLPMTMLKVNQSGEQAICNCDKDEGFLITTSTTARIIVHTWRHRQVDVRKVPLLIVKDQACAEIFHSIGIFPEIFLSEANADVEDISWQKPAGLNNKITWLKSEHDICESKGYLQENGMEITELLFAECHPLPVTMPPDFDAVIFSDGSAAGKFIDHFGPETLADKIICCVGDQAKTVLHDEGNPTTSTKTVKTIQEAPLQLAAYYANRKIKKMRGKKWPEK